MVGIHAIGGMAGIGKTTFAVHAAHRLAERFPDGQLFLPLHAHTPGQRPVDPADALASLLLTAGVAAQQIPPGLEARAARWRDYLAGKKVLLLLDDAAGHEQVRPLLPGTAGSLVLITSRRRLTALEDAAVGQPGHPAAGRGRGAAGPAGRPAGPGRGRRLARAHPAVRVPAAGDRDAGPPAAPSPGLDRGGPGRRAGRGPGPAGADAGGEPVGGGRVRPVLSDLTAGQRRLFRRLGVHPGPDIDAYAAAALDGTTLAAARRHLDGLYDQHLMTEPTRGRYRLHDLLREHARALAAADDPADATPRPGGCWITTCTPPLAAGQHIAAWAAPPPRAARPTRRRSPRPVHPRAGRRLAGRRAGEPARGRRLRRRQRAAPARHRHPGRDERLPGHPRSLGSSPPPCTRPPWPRREAGDRLGRPSALSRLGILAAGDRGLPGRRRQPGRRWSCTAAGDRPARPTP